MSAVNQYQKFGHVNLHKSQIFHETDLIFACVNISPLVPGHVLVCPKREIARYKDLTQEEIIQIFTHAQNISTRLEKHFGTTALNFGLQDGKDSGQSIAHVHLHILPRRKGDFDRNDQIYEELNKDAEMAEIRKKRSLEEMKEEADLFRSLMQDN